MNRFNVIARAIFLSGMLFQPVSVLCQDAAPIKDNSFLIEEAYNQEAGVVQYVLTVQHARSPRHFWDLAYTQEVPLWGMRHQLSWTVPVSSVDERDNLGLADISIHYRLQLTNSDRIAVAPRLTILLPTGDSPNKGAGKVSWQTNLPISVHLAGSVVAHLNAGASIVPNVSYDFRSEGQSGEYDLETYNLGASLVWLLRPNFNVLCEFSRVAHTEVWRESGKIWLYAASLSPGVRMAINTSFGQFVPGMAFPLEFSDGVVVGSIFAYLSFENSVAGL